MRDFATAPIQVDDETIARALEHAHLPSLLAAMVHIGGDMAPLRGGIKPIYDFFSDGQGGLTETQRMAVRAQALAALKAYCDRGYTLPSGPDQTALHEMMNFVAGAEVPDRYVSFLAEEMAFGHHDARAPEWAAHVPESVKAGFKVLIIGAGLSGILAAIRLKQAGIPFIIVEKNSDVAGTWFTNTYPGCRVDNPNHMYSYSFEPNYDWPQHYSPQPVLDAYFRAVAESYGIRDVVQFETVAEECVYNETGTMWDVRLRARDGACKTVAVNAVIAAVGQLSRPKYPQISGRERFRGPSFHSAEWDRNVDLLGKRVAVIGTGASAFQFVPEIAAQVKQLFVLQRSAPWLVPTPDYHDDVADGQKWLLKHVPYYAQWYRFWLFWTLTDGILPMVKADPGWNGRGDAVGAANDMLRQLLTQYTLAQLGDDSELARAAIPDYPPGGKRMLRDNGVWLATLKRDNVELVTDTIAEITPHGLKMEGGRTLDVDIIIYATGFEASRFLEPIRFKGRGGRDLGETWNGNARAYLGITVPGFPNLFMMYGPNTNIVVNGSIIFFSECAMRYISGCIDLVFERECAAMEVKERVHSAFNKKVDDANAQMAWGAPHVSSWYKNEAGRVSQNWPFLLVDYWEMTRAPDPADFEFLGTSALKGAAE